MTVDPKGALTEELLALEALLLMALTELSTPKVDLYPIGNLYFL